MRADLSAAKLERSSGPRSLQLVQRIRLTARLAEQYAQCERRTEPPSPPEASWRRLSDQASLLRRWGRRSPRALAALERRATDFQSDFDAYVEKLRAFAGRPPAPTFRDLYAELLALEEEFGEVEIDLQGKTLSIVTEQIELEEVELGRFRVVLDCSAVERAEYDVVALSAKEPSSSDFAKVTHPHVRDEGLCEGEAHEPIRAALKQGTEREYRHREWVSYRALECCPIRDRYVELLRSASGTARDGSSGKSPAPLCVLPKMAKGPLSRKLMLSGARGTQSRKLGGGPSRLNGRRGARSAQAEAPAEARKIGEDPPWSSQSLDGTAAGRPLKQRTSPRDGQRR